MSEEKKWEKASLLVGLDFFFWSALCISFLFNRWVWLQGIATAQYVCILCSALLWLDLKDKRIAKFITLTVSELQDAAVL